MEASAVEFDAAPAPEGRPGALVAFPFDRSLLERFRAAFPRARFRRAASRWFVPGTTAVARAEAWIDRERAALDAHADAKGRDAYAFEPLASPNLEVGADLVVRSPYSRPVIALLRVLPWARWDPAAKAWRLPFRAYEALRDAWPAIAAAIAEAEERARTRDDPAVRAAEAALAAERRRRRLAVSPADPPPLGEAVATGPFGVVVFEAIDADPVATSPDAGATVFAHWRIPTWRELAAVEPAPEADRTRAWWPPTREDLAERRRRLREGERARATRAQSRVA